MQKRLFISIPLTKAFSNQLAQAQERQRHRDLRWVDPSQFHVTVCFLGDVDEALLVLISDALTSVAQQAKPFDLTLDRVGLFPPKLVRPNMVWAFFHEQPAFDQLIQRVKESLMKADTSFLKLAEEWRKDIPHVTLARFRGNTYPQQFPTLEPQQLRVDSIEIMESVLYREGPLYTSLARFPFHSSHT